MTGSVSHDHATDLFTGDLKKIAISILNLLLWNVFVNHSAHIIFHSGKHLSSNSIRPDE